MVTYEEALQLAISCRSDVDYCTEHEDAFIFSKKDELCFGGNGPVVVLKESGSCINMPAYLVEMGATSIVREGYIKDLG